MTFKLLIAEDARDVAEVVAFGARMTWAGCQVIFAADGAEALQAFSTMAPDLVVIDVEMPVLDGFEVCQRIRARSQVPILMLTVRDTTLDKVRALDLGADDYLTKPFDHIELLARLRALVRRATAKDRQTDTGLTIGALHVDFASHEVRVAGILVRLTSTEYRLLEELMRHPGIILTHQVLLDRVWGPAYSGDAQYLKVFVRRLRQKLGDDATHPRYIQTEWGIGYRFVALP